MTTRVKQLTTVVKTITQEQLNQYAQDSGDRNPLHLDANFAQTTSFGGIIAHGMLTLAFISAMMLKAYSRPWLENGSLKVRFKGAAYVGDEVEAWGEISKSERLEQGQRIICSVGVRNRGNGQEIVSGTATVTVDSILGQGR